MSFRKSLFAVIAFARNAKGFVTFMCTFRKVSEDVHKKENVERCFVGRAPVKFRTGCFFYVKYQFVKN